MNFYALRKLPMSDPPSPSPGKSNPERLDIIEAGERTVGVLISKTAIWAVSVAFIIISTGLTLGVLLWFAGDKLIALSNFQAERDHCRTELIGVKERLSRAEGSIEVLKAKTTAAN